MQCLEDMDVVSPLPSEVCQSSANSCQIPYIPQVKNDVIPKINQEFDTLDVVQNFYNNYAKESGFGTRAHSSRRNGDKQVIRKDYVCCKEGKLVPKKPVENSESSKLRRGLIQEGCGAKLSVRRAKSGDKYVVSQFVEAHNHPLTSPRRVHLLRSHRKVSVAKKSFGTTTIASKCAKLPTNEYFREKNSGFMFTMEKDDEERLTYCFWADATSRQSYQYFGDVVAFDTMYTINRYSMIFAPILGVNHHRQTMLFGCGLLSDESSDSFE
ncbi:protein FAR1-RELATED SEQUENCE 5-like [Rhododendron vialii]|uniref:protein FAR1-RELATED SEQUENCE 5-like n=1 Tax=Rhododendron vialii TaxID=182163 RepID=UPI00265F86CC|nr:protein FAR1-RELATED SEQUENCE 5-like [Rhododendron vialii]